ncbi:hypothetical protein [Microvirga splendida]|uniref:Phospholipase D-like domain-containing protein n=1 Tax=Microvirga splendida TaxID=2795727 RepID=A0ABS0XZD1_9HYPH|nr:hypothetical protein [Microvirga splendida]MBJ6125398.1 hypothetical protein [Microvirga splendida]
MKYPERMARRGTGSRPFHSVVTTTFSIEFAAYEEVMLPQLMASGATNFLVVADERMASMSLSDGSQLPTQLGRDYELFSPPVADGLFHPKIVLQIGRQVGRLFVGSANITAAGLAGNAEAVVELECKDEPSPEREIVRSAWKYVSNLISREPGAAREALNWASDRAPWLVGPEVAPLQYLDDGTAIAFLARDGSASIGSRFMGFIGDEVVDRLVVASPYWDGHLEALGTLMKRMQPASTTVLLDADGHEFPLEAPRSAAIEFRAFPPALKGRFKHAKFVIASTATHDHVLVGSTNCTTAALGRDASVGANAEACIYRMLPRDRAIEALGLYECIEAMPIDPAEVDRRDPSPPIPLDEIASRKAGSFELDGDMITWTLPDGLSGSGSLRLLDASGSEIEIVAFQSTGESVQRRSFRLTLEKPEHISFVVVEQQGFVSNRAHVAHRSLLRRRRREVATGTVAKAIAAFDAGEDFDLWMHNAFDELARADLNDRPLPSIAPVRSRHTDPNEEAEPAEQLTYDDFMETRSPDTRVEVPRDSTLAGTHSDSIRSFLNMLVGKSLPPSDPDDASKDDWMNLGDEVEEGEINTETQRTEPQQVPAPEQRPNDTPVDAKQFVRMVQQYATNITMGTEPLGSSDVLRVRFWLMMLLYKARYPGLPRGLEATADEHGWPRMALRVIAAFFCGRRPPIRRLMIAKKYLEMPVDFLECWVTVLWTLDAMESVLVRSARNCEFLRFVHKARVDVVTILGLTPSELATETVLELRAYLDRTLGARLGLNGRDAA